MARRFLNLARLHAHSAHALQNGSNLSLRWTKVTRALERLQDSGKMSAHAPQIRARIEESITNAPLQSPNTRLFFWLNKICDGGSSKEPFLKTATLSILIWADPRQTNLVPRVLRLFGQRGGARRDSGIMEFLIPENVGFRSLCACLRLKRKSNAPKWQPRYCCWA